MYIQISTGTARDRLAVNRFFGPSSGSKTRFASRWRCKRLTILTRLLNMLCKPSDHRTDSNNTRKIHYETDATAQNHYYTNEGSLR